MSRPADSAEIERALDDLKNNRSGGKKLWLNPRTKKLEIVAVGERDPDALIQIAPEDARVFHRARREDAPA